MPKEIRLYFYISFPSLVLASSGSKGLPEYSGTLRQFASPRVVKVYFSGYIVSSRRLGVFVRAIHELPLQVMP
jgi:hypothetical protein